jgi:glucose/arabinose dehydrogenase
MAAGLPTVGARTEIRVEGLPAPSIGHSTDNPPRVVPRPSGAELRAPDGFEVAPFAEGGFDVPRWLALAPNGDVFLSEAKGTIWVLRDRAGRGVAEERFVFARGLNMPFGMAFRDGWMYVAETDRVVRFRYVAGQTSAQGEPEPITSLPGHGYNQHWTRNIAFSRARPVPLVGGAPAPPEKLFVTVGSETNDAPEPEPRASILVMNPDGSDRRPFARGTRNPVGLAFNPATGALWAAVEERDDLGDELVPDYVTEVHADGFYGWPYAYLGSHEDPGQKGERPDLVARTIVPDVLLQAHSAVLGLVFYDGDMFPPDYRGDAFVALHGSWNRSRRTGQEIVRIPFRGGRPTGGYIHFVTGWMLGEDSKEVWGRPAGLLVARDGSLLIADDAGEKVWRVRYSPAPAVTRSAAPVPSATAPASPAAR